MQQLAPNRLITKFLQTNSSSSMKFLTLKYQILTSLTLKYHVSPSHRDNYDDSVMTHDLTGAAPHVQQPYQDGMYRQDKSTGSTRRPAIFYGYLPCPAFSQYEPHPQKQSLVSCCCCFSCQPSP
jgi:hypothetical protein